MIALLEFVWGSKVGRAAAEIMFAIFFLAAVAGYLEHRGAKQELAELQHSSAALNEQAQKTIATEAAQHAAAVKANQEKTDAALAANTALSAQLDDSVRNFDAYRRAHPDVARPAGGSNTATDGECGARSCGDLASELAVRGNELAGSVGALSATLQSCQRDRDSLTGLPK